MAYEFFYQYLYPLIADSELSFIRLFQYITFRSAYSAVTALLLSLWIAPKLIHYLKKKNYAQNIREDGPDRHLSKMGTPTMGGIVILGVLLLCTVFWGRLDFSYILLLIFTIMVFGILGFVDDSKKLLIKNSQTKKSQTKKAHGLSAKKKLIWQVLLSTIIVFSIAQILYQEEWEKVHSFLKNTESSYEESADNTQNILIQREVRKKSILPLYVPFMDSPVGDWSGFSFFVFVPFLNLPLYVPWLYILFGVFVVVGSSNAVNLTDGLDGLAIGLLIFVSSALGILAYLSGNVLITEYLNIAHIQQGGEIAVFCSALVGACTGFLWYNSHPAQIFMGDTGSLALGGVIGVLALMLKKEILLVLVGGIFVLEVLSVVLQVFFYKWKKKRIFKMAPIHHHFELSGWSESKIIIRLWIIGATLALIALSTLKIQ